MTDQELKQTAELVMNDDYLREALKIVDPITFNLTEELANE